MDSLRNSKNRFKNLSILIVDDSKTSATLIRQQINTLGTPHEGIDICTSYQEAIKQVGKRFYDVLILDYHLEQCINGNELASLLSKKKLLSRQTGVILVSGDSRQETVLTVLSGEIQHFIKKPIQTQALGAKILSVGEDKKSIAAVNKVIEDTHIDSELRAKCITELIDASSSPIIVESSAMEQLESIQDWNGLALLHQISTTPLHMAKVVSIATLNLQQNDVQAAIDLLEDFLSANPLAHKAMDKLVHIFIANELYYDALHLAVRAFECTPSINERMLTAAQLAARLNNQNTLISIGKTFSSHLSIVDVSWLNAVVRYGDCILALLNEHTHPSDSKKLLSCMKHFFRAVTNRVTHNQKPFLNSYIQLFSSKVYMLQNKSPEAHETLFKAVSPYFENFNKLPSVLLVQIVYIADSFGEFWLSESLLAVLKTRNQFDKETQQEVEQLLSDASRYDNVSELQTALESAREILNMNDSSSYASYLKILEVYPLCTEAQLGVLKASILFDVGESSRSKQLGHLKDANLLPKNWGSWLRDIESSGVERPLPQAF
ncbi:response regulator [Vibrio sp. SCSIO 43135]|uniref:response regulator n=1 Tax=Vibrio sp. SCSIO 43135 TaxID=2819096 RepID=UPI00207658B2|nr:response regulator [Vibrio sp. SCSIO 43135]USD40039.1 response regulator [Vibrio sp. SCSIO 43135]